MRTIRIEVNGEERTVLRKDYVRLKTKDLKEFGYSTLTETEVDTALEAALKGEANDVIAMFIKQDLAETQ